MPAITKAKKRKVTKTKKKQKRTRSSIAAAKMKSSANIFRTKKPNVSVSPYTLKTVVNAFRQPSTKSTPDAGGKMTVKHKPIKKLLTQADIDEGRAEKIRKLPPEKRAKINAFIKEQEAKIKAFTDTLPESDKPAFRRFSENLQLAMFKRKVQGKDEELDIGLDSDKYNFEREVVKTLGYAKMSQFKKVVADREKAVKDFRDTLPDDETKEAFAAFVSSPNFDRIKQVVDQEKADVEKAAEAKVKDTEAKSVVARALIRRIRAKQLTDGDKAKKVEAIESQLRQLNESLRLGKHLRDKKEIDVPG